MADPISAIFELYREFGHSDYIGEPVSQVQHMVQCAELAEKEGFGQDVILGAFLHDIGHLIGLKDPSHGRMGHLGAINHEEIGAQYLESLGFPGSVCAIVRGHVAAKRYLVYKYPDYHDSLSEASKGTLVHQGGPMTEEEATVFEKMPNFDAVLRTRHWDDQAKDPSIPVHSAALRKYENMTRELLSVS